MLRCGADPKVISLHSNARFAPECQSFLQNLNDANVGTSTIAIQRAPSPLRRVHPLAAELLSECLGVLLFGEHEDLVPLTRARHGMLRADSNRPRSRQKSRSIL
ncbi:hypothetical protein ACMYR2_2754 [Nitrobacter sp. TKz-YC01]